CKPPAQYPELTIRSKRPDADITGGWTCCPSVNSSITIEDFLNFVTCGCALRAGRWCAAGPSQGWQMAGLALFTRYFTAARDAHSVPRCSRRTKYGLRQARTS